MFHIFGIFDAGYFQIGNLSGAMTPNIKADTLFRTINTKVCGTLLCVRAISKAMASQDLLSYKSAVLEQSFGRSSIVFLKSVNSYDARCYWHYEDCWYTYFFLAIWSLLDDTPFTPLYYLLTYSPTSQVAPSR